MTVIKHPAEKIFYQKEGDVYWLESCNFGTLTLTLRRPTRTRKVSLVLDK